ncbi:3-phosphoshikimate 1-carboxyvinyltransferase [Pontibacter sp. BT310]|uniref:3-phosphoshikimate 1-carboxyvinyltransferase n=1 Tax=Pontibacter populi TaxID=890055 RepID=A0ABS6X6T8_9BACT|nr:MULTISPECIES: 3-phosphoshikimate 1-carboxyvinyltransferase [Pontibacter]MBJ6116852.1 3-phosphoshikimate 1-carboxyvinyltransferase [Pontibacter sp. BT310]MBR0569274.1 3-phosphoshikimate 1-carboxyvinyltransferase [Microvirga sp. STS03]MBW3363705.1 3-phosphoshikimate 1-carboxyvinyltransferase [Pontibacter populi]
MIKTVTLSHPTGVLSGTINLPASKSEANRALIIAALAGGNSDIQNLSEANDTQLLQRLLKSDAATIDAEDAGTVMRFLTAYYVITGQQKTLTGTDRMCQRPIKILVEALRELGATIDYLQQEGYPPLKISGFKGIGNNHLKVRSDISSQYISALLMIAPLLPDGLILELEGKIGSRPYIEMTLSLMQHFGVSATFENNMIVVANQNYNPATFAVEPDWSAASYWYSMVALAKEADITLPGLRENSYQGDRAIVDIMSRLGVYTEFTETGIRLTKKHCEKKVAFDFTNCPDLAQTIVALCAALGVTLEMTGLESLRIKETDRIQALQIEVLSMGASLDEMTPGVFRMEPAILTKSELTFRTYQDHRMAMAFAPIALLEPVQIQEPSVVRKSYPRFWEDLEKVGFEVIRNKE